MARPQLVNFHYENQLFDSSLSPSQIKKINSDFEYIALLWGDVDKLLIYSDYDPDYLDYCTKINPQLPQLYPYNGQEDHDLFWGETDDLVLQRHLNSKETSFHVGRQLGVNPDQGIILENQQMLDEYVDRCVFPIVVRVNSSVAGRGVFRLYHLQECKEFFIKSKNIWRAGGLVLEPLYQRVRDFGVLFREKVTFYENIIDHRGQFRGIVIRPEHEFFESLNLEITYIEFQNIYQKIFEEYKQRGAQAIQVDSFVYISEGKNKLYPLVEVNARKTMGEFATRLHQRLMPDKKYSLFYLLKNKTNFWPEDAIRLSPKDAQHQSAFEGFSNVESLNQALRCYHDDIFHRRQG